VDLPTYTNIWRIEKRLYKLYDFRLPMPLPINWIAVFTGITLPYVVLLIAIGLPFNHTLLWLYILPPGLLTWLTTRPVIEGKRLPELVESQARYLTEPRTWVRLTPLAEKDQMALSARVWRGRQASERAAAAMAAAAAAAASPAAAGAGRGAVARRGRAKARVPAVALNAAPVPVRDHGQRAARMPRPAAGQVLTPGTAIRPRMLALGSGGGNGNGNGAGGMTGGRSAPSLSAMRPGPHAPAPQPARSRPPVIPAVVEGVPIRARAGATGAPLLEVSHDRLAHRPAPAGPSAPPAAARPVTTLPGGNGGHVGNGGTTWPAPARPLRPVRTTPPSPEPPSPEPPQTAGEPGPADAAPAEANAVDVPIAAAPVEAVPVEAMPVEATPVDAASVEATPVEATPVAAEPEESRPVGPAPQPEEAVAAPEHIEPEPVEPALVAQGPIEQEPVEQLPAEPEPVEQLTAEPEPAEPEPVEQESAEPEPAEPAPPQNSPADPVPLTPASARVTPPDGLPQLIEVPAEVAAAAPADQARLEHSHEPAQAPVAAVQQSQNRVVPSIERALSGPAREQNPSWHGKVKIVTGAGASHGPGARDQEALDRNRARLEVPEPRRILVLGCTGGAGQTVTALMTGYMLASLREHPVAVVDLHDGTLARYRAPAAWLDEILAGRPPQQITSSRPDGLNPSPKPNPARLDVIASHQQPRDGDEIKLAVQLNRHYPLTVLDPGPSFLTRLLKVTDQLVVVVPANAEAAGALADTRDWLDNNGHAELAMQSVTVINGVSRRSLPDVEHAETIARGRSRAIVRIPWDDMLPVAAAGPSTLRPQTRVAYTALAGVLVAGLTAVPVRKKQ
jgi:MinD-like ATPase involved in chromosome partitioning or flagellar assembly